MIRITEQPFAFAVNLASAKAGHECLKVTIIGFLRKGQRPGVLEHGKQCFGNVLPL